MSCEINNPEECGVGYNGPGWRPPLPGDSSNVPTISAKPVRTGIEVFWTYPASNEHAVSSFKLFRNTTPSFETAALRVQQAGNLYNDLITVEEPTAFYYWVQVLTVNGTLLGPVGPASAVARPWSEGTIGDISGEIDRSALNQYLNQEIDNITRNYNELTAEIANRVNSDTALASAIAAVQSGLQDSLGLIHTESITRQNGYDALASQMTTIAAMNQQNAAAIFQTNTTLVNETSALASSISSLETATQQAQALLQNQHTVLSNEFGSFSSSVTSWQTQHQQDFNAIEQLVFTQSGDINNLTQDLQFLGYDFNNLQSSVNSAYVIKMQGNNKVGGFGLVNNNNVFDFAVIADRFFISATNTSGNIKPFIVQNGIVYIDDLRIRGGSITAMHSSSAMLVNSVSAYQTRVAAKVNISMPANSSGVTVMATVSFMPISGDGECGISIWKSGAGNGQGYVASSAKGGYRVSTTTSTTFSNVSGNLTFDLVVHAGSQDITLHYVNISAIGGKK